VLGGFDADAAEDEWVVEVEPRRGGAGDFLGGCGGLQAIPHRFRVHGGGAPGDEEGRPRHLIPTWCRVRNQDARSSVERRLLQSCRACWWGSGNVGLLGSQADRWGYGRIVRPRLVAEFF